MTLRAIRLLAALALALAWTSAAHAATFPVTKTEDTNDGFCADDCSLREAIVAANAAGGPDDVTVPAGLYLLTIAGAGEDASATGDLDAVDSITITGAGAGSTIIDAGGDAGLLDRVLDFHFATLGSSAAITGVTITGGRASSDGGGLQLTTPGGSGTLTVRQSVVSGNTTDVTSEGGGLVENGGSLVVEDSAVVDNLAGFGGGLSENGGDSLTVTRSLIASNDANGTGGDGGGLIEDGGGTLTVSNSTITGNSAPSGGGLSGDGGGTTTVSFSTIAGNTGVGPPRSGRELGGNVFEDGGGTITLDNTIVANGTPQNCFSSSTPTSTIVSAGHNLESSATCGFAGPGDLQSDPILGALADNGGPTQTLALLQGSPAIDAAGAPCPAIDQRGLSRPFGSACDIGAFEFRPAPPPPLVPEPPLVPDFGRTIQAEVISGKVFISVPPGATAAQRSPIKGRRFEPLTATRLIPIRSFLDTRKGKVRLTSSTDAANTAFQNGAFTSGVFQVLQSRKPGQRGLTELRLKGSSFSPCTARRRGKRTALSTRRRRLSTRTVRRLNGDANGRFRTRGRHSAATVRGTIWTVTDRCDGTLTRVKRGSVAVRDFRRRKTVLVRSGKRYLARARG